MSDLLKIRDCDTGESTLDVVRVSEGFSFQIPIADDDAFTSVIVSRTDAERIASFVRASPPSLPSESSGPTPELLRQALDTGACHPMLSEEGSAALQWLRSHLPEMVEALADRPALLADRERLEIQDETLQRYNAERLALLAQRYDKPLDEHDGRRLATITQLLRDMWPAAMPSDYARLLEIKQRGDARRAKTNAMLEDLGFAAARVRPEPPTRGT